MYDVQSLSESNILEWLFVLGYLSVTVFIIWQVVNTKPRE
jgi:hypothetical protein